MLDGYREIWTNCLRVCRREESERLRDVCSTFVCEMKLCSSRGRLQNRRQREWGDKVKLLFGDMRFINVPEKADILVSELLGSFGDNELSPECLDGAMRFLKRALPAVLRTLTLTSILNPGF